MVWQELLLMREQIADFLGIFIINNALISIDIWSILHILAGVIVVALILAVSSKKLKKNQLALFLILFVVLVAYELFEFAFYRIDDTVFRPESKINVLWDLIFGAGSGAIFLLSRKRLK